MTATADTDASPTRTQRVAYSAAIGTVAVWAGSALIVLTHPAPWTIVLAISATAGAVTAAWFHTAITTVPTSRPAWRVLLSVTALGRYPLLAGSLMVGAYFLVHAGVVLLSSPNPASDAARFVVIAMACFALHRTARRHDYNEPTQPTGDGR